MLQFDLRRKGVLVMMIAASARPAVGHGFAGWPSVKQHDQDHMEYFYLLSYTYFSTLKEYVIINLIIHNSIGTNWQIE